MSAPSAVIARYAIGIGARSGVDAREAVALIRKACETYVRAPSPAFSHQWEKESRVEIALFTIDAKCGELGLHEAARLLDMTIVFLPLEELRARKHETLTRSPRVEALTGVGSVAEAAALVGAGKGGLLLGPRLASARATCAIARNALDEGP
ncbi:cobalamin biosynthesis protein [Methylosinus sp. H3A]|uniref:cobalamin biosynthesis protein n=1 Tax=Methylosinus sp. H3A TaxID=2785786 RepID=UPI001FED62D3|nr:cobalamin biosynthesis protein [Methylosinus sp. H3A]